MTDEQILSFSACAAVLIQIFSEGCMFFIKMANLMPSQFGPSCISSSMLRSPGGMARQGNETAGSCSITVS